MLRKLLLPLLFAMACNNPSTSPTVEKDSITEVSPDSQTLNPKQRNTTLSKEEELEDGWIDMAVIDSTIFVDIKYATADNFVGVVLYNCARCILRREVAEALILVQRKLKEYDLGIKVFDCYRPRQVQELLWEKVPDARYVTPPDKGSMHNRGAAVDLTLVDADGNALEMGTPYDYFGEEAYHTYLELPDSVLQRRSLLREVMAESGFKHIRTEWWHYSYQEYAYKVSDYLWPCPD